MWTVGKALREKISERSVGGFVIFIFFMVFWLPCVNNDCFLCYATVKDVLKLFQPKVKPFCSLYMQQLEHS